MSESRDSARMRPGVRGLVGIFMAFATLSFCLLAQSASAAKLTVLHAFCSDDYCTDGSSPMGTPALDAAGNIYGTTQGTNSVYAGFPYGTVFKLSPTKVFTRLHEFCSLSGCDDGIYPQSDITLDAKGNLYGVATMGGTREKGVVFKISPAGALTTLHSFCSNEISYICVDGNQPQGSIVLDKTGTVYGLTASGGKHNYGLLYEVGADEKLTQGYSFCGATSCADGESPDGRLLNDGKGNLYGVTYYGGGHGYGEIFKFTIATRRVTVLYSFCKLSGCPDGAYPHGGLVMDNAGNVYGVTSYGGGSANGGILYKITPGKTLSVLRKFCALSYCTDGDRPNGALAINKAGVIYGTTGAGGNTSGRGVLFSYDTVKKAYKLTYSFCAQTSCTDGATPAVNSGVAIDKYGTLYGTTTYGGTGNQGIVYKIIP